MRGAGVLLSSDISRPSISASSERILCAHYSKSAIADQRFLLRPFRCTWDECGKSFPQRASLDRHMNIVSCTLLRAHGP
jgi:hypothetical protein